jgi:hypothetical protein
MTLPLKIIYTITAFALAFYVSYAGGDEANASLGDVVAVKNCAFCSKCFVGPEADQGFSDVLSQDSGNRRTAEVTTKDPFEDPTLPIHMRASAYSVNMSEKVRLPAESIENPVEVWEASILLPTSVGVPV